MYKRQVLSRKGYLLKKPLTMVIMFTMYFTGGMIPFYLWINQLGMVDTRWAILLPTALNTYNTVSYTHLAVFNQPRH